MKEYKFFIALAFFTRLFGLRLTKQNSALRKKRSNRQRQFDEFCEETSFHGFAEFKRSKWMKIIWLLVMVGLGGWCSYMIYMIVTGYLQSPITTDSIPVPVKEQELPPMKICLANSISASKAAAFPKTITAQLLAYRMSHAFGLLFDMNEIAWMRLAPSLPKMAMRVPSFYAYINDVEFQRCIDEVVQSMLLSENISATADTYYKQTTLCKDEHLTEIYDEIDEHSKDDIYSFAHRTALWLYAHALGVDVEGEAKNMEDRCFKDMYKCNDTFQCIPDFLKCDGILDCVDGTDEGKDFCEGEACPKGFGICTGIHVDEPCFEADARCDGIDNCADGNATDEMNCTTSECDVDDDKFGCKNGQCLLKNRVCDSTIDCLDTSDESEWACKEVGRPWKPITSASDYNELEEAAENMWSGSGSGDTATTLLMESMQTMTNAPMSMPMEATFPTSMPTLATSLSATIPTGAPVADGPIPLVRRRKRAAKKKKGATLSRLVKINITNLILPTFRSDGNKKSLAGTIEHPWWLSLYKIPHNKEHLINYLTVLNAISTKGNNTRQYRTDGNNLDIVRLATDVSHNVDQVFRQCRVLGKTFECSQYIKKTYDSKYGVCFQLSLPPVNQTEAGLGISLLLRTNFRASLKAVGGSSYYPATYDGATISFERADHSRASSEFQIASGVSAVLTLSKTEYDRKVSESRGGCRSSMQTEIIKIGNYSSDMCQTECFYQSIFKHCKCIPPLSKQQLKEKSMENQKTCLSYDERQCWRKSSFLKSSTCLDQCLPACEDLQFDAGVTYQWFPSNEFRDLLTTIPHMMLYASNQLDSSAIKGTVPKTRGGMLSTKTLIRNAKFLDALAEDVVVTEKMSFSGDGSGSGSEDTQKGTTKSKMADSDGQQLGLISKFFADYDFDVGAPPMLIDVSNHRTRDTCAFAQIETLQRMDAENDEDSDMLDSFGSDGCDLAAEEYAETWENEHMLLLVAYDKFMITKIAQRATMTFNDFVGQIGGSFGLFLGGSLMSCLHLIVSLAQWLCPCLDPEPKREEDEAEDEDDDYQNASRRSSMASGQSKRRY